MVANSLFVWTNIYEVHLASQRKHLIKRLKLDLEDQGWLEYLVGEATLNQQMYLSEVLTECFKNSKLSLKSSTALLVVETLKRNVESLVERNCSPDEIASLGVSCLGLQLFLKSKYNSIVDKTFLSDDFLKSLVTFINSCEKNGSIIPRDSLILILPLVIYIKVECRGGSAVEVLGMGKDLFTGSLYYLANWHSCLLKLYTLPKSDEALIVALLNNSITELKKSTVWYLFIYFDIMVTCLRRYQALLRSDKDILYRIFRLVVFYSDDKGFNLTNATEEIQLQCLILCPALISDVDSLSRGPWYSSNTLIYQALFLQHSQPLLHPNICSILEGLLGRLGYNRIDHKTLKAIKTLLSRYLSKETFAEFLQICVGCVAEKPGCTRLIALYVAPLFQKGGLFPSNLEEMCTNLISSSQSVYVKVVLFYTFYNFFKGSLTSLLVDSMVSYQ